MKSLIVGNWKCNPVTLKGAKLLFNSIKNGIKDIENACPERSRKVEIVICPPFVYLSNIQYLISNIKLGAQDVFWETSGAYTGEVSPLMLKDAGVEYVIIGHSERRQYFNETDEIVNKKIKAALDAGLKPILCVGETGKEKKAGKTKKILEKQLEILKTQNLKSNIQNLIIAYEPIWAIGTGNPCGADEAKKTGLTIREIIAKQFGRENIRNVRVLYGGSANSDNAVRYIKDAQMNGLLIGGVSLKPQEFIKIIHDIGKI